MHRPARPERSAKRAVEGRTDGKAVTPFDFGLRPSLRTSVFAATLLLAACEASGTTVIDGSSAERFAATTEAARSELPVADRLDFDRALATIGGRRHSVNDTNALARTTFDGMTADEVVADYRARK